MDGKLDLSDLFEQSRFIFKGMVVRAGASGVQLLPSSDKTAVVVVEEVFRGGQAVRNIQGTEVTVVLRNPQGINLGKSYLFFANSFLYGEQIALHEVERQEWSSVTTEILERLLDLDIQSKNRPFIQRVREADVIITGKVMGLRPAQTKPGHRSLHDPDWWIATVQVTSVEKGQRTKPEIEVIFANGRDSYWHNAPKLHAGDHRILILRREEIKQLEGEFYAVTDPFDYLPFDRIQEVKQALGGSA